MLSAAPAESVTGHAENKHLGAGRVTRCETSRAGMLCDLSDSPKAGPCPSQLVPSRG